MGKYSAEKSNMVLKKKKQILYTLGPLGQLRGLDLRNVLWRNKSLRVVRKVRLHAGVGVEAPPQRSQLGVLRQRALAQHLYRVV